MGTRFAGLICSVAVFACTNSGTEPAPFVAPPAVDGTTPTRQAIANISYQDIPSNVIVNGELEDYADANIPDSWTVDEIYGYVGMYSPVQGWRGLGVQLTRNAQGQHMLRQVVGVSPHRRYTAQMVYRVIASDSSRGGLYVLEPGDNAVLASSEINRPTNGWQIATTTFDSGDHTSLVVAIGYPAGMNGTVVYDGISMFEDSEAYRYQLETSYRDAIGIAPAPADDLVPQLSDYVTALLAAPLAERVAHRDAYGAELPYYLNTFLGEANGVSGRAAWCQHTSLALGELLALYGVPTRQIHATAVQHQFLEYFDGKRWVAFDPYYGIRYVINRARLGIADAAHAGLEGVSIEVPTRNHVFLLEIGYLKTLLASGAFANGLTM